MLKENPELAGAFLASAPGCDGAMLGLLVDLGAATRDLSVVEATFGTVVDEGAPLHPCLAVYLGAVAVSVRGRRFVDESRPYKEIGRACLAQPGGVAVQVLDRGILESGVAGVGPFDLAAWAGSGYLRRHESLAELAAFRGFDPDVLRDELDAYNADVVAHGRDRRHGRSGLPGAGALVPVASPPFYSCLSSSAVYGTYGGVHADRSLRVVKSDGSLLAGCYAAGEIVGGFHGAGYMTGSSLGKAVVFGRLAARHALGLSAAVDEAWSPSGRRRVATAGNQARKGSMSSAE